MATSLPLKAMRVKYFSHTTSTPNPPNIITMKKTLHHILLLALSLLWLWSLYGCSDEVEISASKSIPIEDNTRMPLVNVFLENSGSMDGYMCEGSDLKNALFSYISDLEQAGAKVRKYYVNSQEIPYDLSTEQYIRDLSPESFRMAGGNRANSDILQLLDDMVGKVTSSSVSIFVSDCILDLPATDSQKYLKFSQISMRNAINKGRKRLPNLGVQVLQMFSEFTGKYYYPKGGNESLYGVKRPYYIWIFGTADQLARMSRNVSFERLKGYGLKQMVTFAPQTESAYAIIDGKGEKNAKTVRAQQDAYTFSFKVDLSKTLQDEKTLLSAERYTLNREKLQVADSSSKRARKPMPAATISIYPIPHSDSYTHSIELTFPKRMLSRRRKLTIALQASVETPQWVTSSNDETGEDICQNLSKTTGIKYLINGVSEAYGDVTTWCEFNFDVKQ